MDNKGGQENRWRDEEKVSRAWGIVIFGLIGSTITSFAIVQFRRTHLFHNQSNRSHTTFKNATNGSSRRTYGEEAWRNYHHQTQEEYEVNRQRVERMRCAQRIFLRERDRYKSNERWRENDSGAYQQYTKDYWYWNTGSYNKNYGTGFRSGHMDAWRHPMAHHYSVLGLDRSRMTTYSDADIKSAFRAKAMKVHPDQNQDNPEAAEAKFKEVMVSYEAIKNERTNYKI